MTDHASDLANVKPQASTSVAIEPAVSALSLVRPIAQPMELLAYQEDLSNLIKNALKPGVDYAAVPGTNVPALMKPGAERLNLAFGATPEIEILEKEIDHHCVVRWTKRKKVYNNRYKGDNSFTMANEEGTSFGLYRYVVLCKIVRSGRVLGECIGACSTLESKYIDRPRDCENTALKIAQKRAFVGATVTAFALSNRFGEDAIDHADDVVVEHDAQAPQGSTKYNGGKAHRDALKKAMISKQVPEDQWESIHSVMIGKSFTELDSVLKSRTQD